MLDEGALERRSVIPALSYRAGEGVHEPGQRATSHRGRRGRHVRVCDMARNPVDQLAVVRDSVHAE